MRKSRSAQAYKAALPVAQRNLKKAADAGLFIIMGTDSGASANRFEGYFEHVEMQMMAESELRSAQIIRSATIDAARAMRVKDVCSIAKETGPTSLCSIVTRLPTFEIRNPSAPCG